jgi:hypothetical protein
MLIWIGPSTQHQVKRQTPMMPKFYLPLTPMKFAEVCGNSFVCLQPAQPHCSTPILFWDIFFLQVNLFFLQVNLFFLQVKQFFGLKATLILFIRDKI